MRPTRPTSPYKDKLLDLRRVARVVKGGKRMSFRATVVIGTGHGQVGVGLGKGLDAPAAIGKAKNRAIKNIFSVPLINGTIPHEVEAKFSAARIRLKPAKPGHGLKAGGAIRTVLLLAGIKNITAKALGRTPNKLTNALAAINALKDIKKQPVKEQAMEKQESEDNQTNN